MSGWSALSNELDAWAEAGRAATFWWRDDDAAKPTVALDRLLELAHARDIPLCLAVVPVAASHALAPILARAPNVVVAVHGYAHVNHAQAGAKKAEYGAEREPEVMLEELAAGRERLEDLFGVTLQPILAPPWNRIAGALICRLPEAKFRGLSTYRPRPSMPVAPGLRQVNTHIDIIDWRNGRGFLGEEAALALALEHLAARREGLVDGEEPTGLLSHHLIHDAGAWDFVAAFLDATRRHPSARWLSAPDAFGLDP